MNSDQIERVPVLVTNGWLRIAYNVVESLGRRGVPVHVVDSSRLAMCRKSRWTRSFHEIPNHYADPEGFDALINVITDATIHYLKKQIESGAEVVKLFDSWAGALSPATFEKYSVQPTIRIIKALGQAHPDVPVIAFPRGAGASYIDFSKKVPARALALDTQVPLDWAMREMPDTVLQGNMDPMFMVVGGDPLADEARKICDQMHGHPHIFNLGHGITPDADPGSVDVLLRAIRG